MTNLILGIAIAFGIMGIDAWNAHVNEELKDVEICYGRGCHDEKDIKQVMAMEPQALEEESPSEVDPTPVIHDLGTPVSYIRHVFGNKSDLALAIVECESRFNPNALFCGNNNGSCDRGLWQINSYWHSEVSDAEAFNWKLATDHAYRIYVEAGYSFSPWVCLKLIDK